MTGRVSPFKNHKKYCEPKQNPETEPSAKNKNKGVIIKGKSNLAKFNLMFD